MSTQETGITWTNAIWNPVTGCSLDQPIRWNRPRMIFVNSISDLFHEDVPFEFIDKVFAVMAATPHHTFQILTKRPERMKEYIDSVTKASKVPLACQYYSGEKIKFNSRSELIASYIMFEFDCKKGASLDGIKWEGPDESPDLIVWPLPNVWLGVTAENQETANSRIPMLLNTPAALRFVSVEPMVGPVNLDMMITQDARDRFRIVVSSLMGKKTLWDTKNLMGEEDINKIDWVICGGESGTKARPVDPEWIQSLRDQCAFTETPFFFKQWGEFIDESQMTDRSTQMSGKTYHSLALDKCISDSILSKRAITLWRCGKRAAGNKLDGEVVEQFPFGVQA